ncbi:hypothetical protein [Pelagerythrobacter rhizovicinus]|uniref:ATP-binding protein n=1 Tax=Pelagerythrobacter rhizovicinus TaxID=2268576 RepID=A0A4Q2KIS3_9SPHN|nr:hypothetical protein [Pelagerythrobacter rhizovicinus]RXZ64239.1 hypothetical protein ETX26_10020 [Pelagerythrobacter rhizovicinus]
MRITAQSTIAASERALTSLSQAPAGEPLRLPSNIRHLAGGAEAALTQVIISWAQQNPDALLETFIESPEQIGGFVRRLPGLVAGLCAKKATGHGQTGSIATALHGAALARLDQLQSERPKRGYRGASAEIVCADHLGRDTPYLLYLPGALGGSGLRPRENFRDLASWLLRGAIRGSYRDHVPADAADAIGAMLFEIFKNTEDHALTDIAGDLLDVSIRAIKTNHHAMAPDQLARIVGEYAPLARYCDALTVPQGAVFTHLFELSVLDSGPGFAATWTGSALPDLSLEDEDNAVRACFGKGSAKGQSRFGEGLPHVLRLLRRQKGFLRLRTGRLSFFIDFSDEEHAADGALRRYEQAGLAALAPVAGSLMTILIPMQRA